MLILHDPQCAAYGSSMRPEQPARVTATAAHLRSAHPDWTWRIPTTVVTDDGLPQLSATNQIIVVINEINSAPVLPAVTNYTLAGLQPLTVTNTATDSDIPATVGPSSVAATQHKLAPLLP